MRVFTINSHWQSGAETAGCYIIAHLHDCGTSKRRYFNVKVCLWLLKQNFLFFLRGFYVFQTFQEPEFKEIYSKIFCIQLLYTEIHILICNTRINTFQTSILPNNNFILFSEDMYKFLTEAGLLEDNDLASRKLLTTTFTRQMYLQYSKVIIIHFILFKTFLFWFLIEVK